MIRLERTTPLPVGADRAWAFFRDLDARYAEWHPEHLRWKTIRGEPLTDGAVVFADEWVGRMRVTGRLFTRSVEPGRFFAYRIGFPSSLVAAGGSFRLTPTDGGGCELHQVVHMGFEVPLAGALVDLLLRAIVPVGELERHMREEAERLVAILRAESAG